MYFNACILSSVISVNYVLKNILLYKFQHLFIIRAPVYTTRNVYYNKDHIKIGISKEMSTVGERICELRIKAGLNQRELAFELGFAPSTISNYESDTRLPTIPDLTLLADVIQTRIGDYKCYLFTGVHNDELNSIRVEKSKYILKEEVILKVSEYLKDLIQLNEIRLSRKATASIIIKNMVQNCFNDMDSKRG
jgi:transcriptional regulator with XRE-family HTH domain